MNCQILFSGKKKIRKSGISLSSAELAKRVVKVKEQQTTLNVSLIFPYGNMA